MARTLHFGIVGRNTDQVRAPRQMPGTFSTDGDSFRVWGERDDDRTLHVLLTFQHEPTNGAVALLRGELEGWLNPHERLADYVVSTDSEDWSEDVSLNLFDGTSAYVSPLPATR